MDSFKFNVGLFSHYLRMGKYANAYDIVKIYIDNENFGFAIKLLLQFKQAFPKTSFVAQEIVHKCIKEVLEKKYPFLKIDCELSEGYNDANELITYLNFNIDGESLRYSEVFELLSKHKNWALYQEYELMVNYYSSAQVNRHSFDNFKHNTWKKTNRTLYLSEVVEKRLKYYFLNSSVKFGENAGKTVHQILEINPQIVRDYFNNLNHFTFTLDFFMHTRISNTLGEYYWTFFERNILKICTLTMQSHVLMQLDNYRKILREEQKDLYEGYKGEYAGYFENDSDNFEY